jgi:hypothetical protein
MAGGLAAPGRPREGDLAAIGRDGRPTSRSHSAAGSAGVPSQSPHQGGLVLRQARACGSMISRDRDTTTEFIRRAVRLMCIDRDRHATKNASFRQS